MTRKEIRNNAATNYGYAVAGGCLERGYIQDAFERGAEWADAHPINPWHKASEELPEEKGYYFLWRDGDIRPITGWFDGWEFDNIPDVAYWMEIPKIKEE